MTGKEIVDGLTAKGYDDKSIRDFLCDGEALTAEGYMDDDQGAIEEAYSMVTTRMAASVLGRKGGSVKSPAKSAAAVARNARRKAGGKPEGGRPKAAK